MADGQGVTEDELYRMMYGSIAFEMLHAASVLGVFEYLGKNAGATQEKIGAALGLEPYPCDVLITGLRGLELLLDDGNSGLRNAPLVEECFVHGKDAQHLPFIHEVINPGMAAFVESLRAGTNLGLRRFPGDGNTLYERLEHDLAKQRSLHTHLQATSESTMADLIRTGALSGATHLLDIGGGAGNNAIALAKQYPDLRITLLDLARVTADAAANIAAHGLSERITVRACDVFTDPLPADADAALLTHMLPIWSPETNQALLRKVYDALPGGGRVLVFDAVQNDRRDGPDYAILFPAYYLTVASGRGNFYTGSAYEQWIRDAGFGEHTTFDGLAVAHSLHVGRK